ncbi:hypothetical protein [Myxococcus sp. CA040A]|uniref:hypothetical protein n=1 Tax=Myxococcus sp. CA040A TaxID=2741738 RepID=UPI00157B1E2D|nr:hypothetical protein [Myxococcus sp. CA040A]NTX08952.1 hypothetical protein [Myxococcus sp. CA040A]
MVQGRLAGTLATTYGRGRMGAVATKGTGLMATFSKRGPLDVRVQKPAILTLEDWLYLEEVKKQRRAAGEVSPFTGRRPSRNDALWLLVALGREKYDEKYGKVVIPESAALDDDEEDEEKPAPRAKKTAAKKGGKS